MLALSVITLALSALGVDAFARDLYRQRTFDKRDVYPADVTGYKHFTSPEGYKVHYKEPGKEGYCETTPGMYHPHQETRCIGLISLTQESILTRDISRLRLRSMLSSGFLRAATIQPPIQLLYG